MTANWSKPDLNSTKSNFPAEIRALAQSAVKLDPTGDSNIPVGAMYYNRSTKVLYEWDGATWQPLEITNLAVNSVYAASIVANGILTPAKFATPFRTLLSIFHSTITTGSGSDTNMIICDGGSTIETDLVAVPFSLVVTHVSLSYRVTSASQNVTVKLFKNGSDQSSTFTINSGSTNNAGALSSPITFAANDRLQLTCTQPGLSGSRELWAHLWGYSTS